MGLGAAAVISLVSTAVTTGVSMHQSAQAAEKQDELLEQKQALNNAQQREDRRRQVREARIRRAQIEQSSVNSGVGGSSGEGGAVSTISSNLGANLGTIGSNVRAGEEMSAKAQEVSNIANRIQTTQAIGGLASSIFNVAGSNGLFNTESTVQQPKGPSPIFNYNKGRGMG